MYSSTSIIDEIRESFRKGSALTKLIYINLGVFVFVYLVFVIFFLFKSGDFTLPQKKIAFEIKFLSWLELPSNIDSLLHRPWTVFTYMFLHFGFLHILLNLLGLFWFGRIFLHYLNPKQLLTTYIVGGLAGAIVYLISYNIFPGLSDGLLLGASASVMAIMIGISFYVPNNEVYIPIFGTVKLKYLALACVLLDILLIASDNSGGHLAHLGGALYGYLFAVQLKRGKDLGKNFTRLFDFIAGVFSRKAKLKVSYKNNARGMNDLDYNKAKIETQKEIDKILDKIAQSGYDSLTKKEKETLFKMSNKS